MAGKDAFSLVVTGAAETARMFRLLPEKVQRRALPPALRKACAPIRKRARSMVYTKIKKKTGAIRRALGTKVLKPAKNKSKRTAQVRVRAESKFWYTDKNGKIAKPGKYALPLEYGSGGRFAFLRPAAMAASGESKIAFAAEFARQHTEIVNREAVKALKAATA